MNWGLWAPIAAVLVAALLGAWAQRRAERRPRLLAYKSNIGAFKQGADVDGNESWVYTHSVVVRNVGGKPANEVRIGHQGTPAFHLYPNVAYRTEELPDGGFEIILPAMVPNEEVSVYYLYAPPLTVHQINTHVKSREGFAEWINVLTARQYSKPTLTFIAILMLLGMASLLYMAAIAVEAIFRL